MSDKHKILKLIAQREKTGLGFRIQVWLENGVYLESEGTDWLDAITKITALVEESE